MKTSMIVAGSRIEIRTQDFPHMRQEFQSTQKGTSSANESVIQFLAPSFQPFFSDTCFLPTISHGITNQETNVSTHCICFGFA
jgi:hypothetical protein